MKIKGITIAAILLIISGNLFAQGLPPDSIPVFKADSIKAVYVYADTGIALNKIDSKGMKEGLWVKRYDDGDIRYTGHFWDNHPYGVFKNYYDGGDSLESLRIFSDDGKTAYSHMFYTTGALMAEGKYVNEQKDSIWKYYSAAQQLIRKDNYKNGLLNGKSVVFYPSGHVLEVLTFENNLQEGPYVQYFDEGGIKEEGTYKNGMLQDTLTVYEPDGKIAAQCFYVDDLKEGNLVYYANGRPKDTLTFRHGRCTNMAKFSRTHKEEDALKQKYQKLQEQLEHPGTLDDEYRQPGGEQ